MVDFDRVVSALCSPLEWELEHTPPHAIRMVLPARHKVIECFNDLRGVLFPGFFGYREFSDAALPHYVGAAIDRIANSLEKEIRYACHFVNGWEYDKGYATAAQVPGIIEHFIGQLPAVRKALVADAQACYEWDPAVFIPEAPIFCYPNMLAMMNYRLAHVLYEEGVPFIPRIATEYAHSMTGIDIHPGAKIGKSCFIDHGTGVVIGQTAVLGDRVWLYQGVTLGALRFPLDEKTQRPLKGIPRHPVVEDDVVIYAEATVLGRVTIGARSIIGANVFLAKSIPPDSKVFTPPVRISKRSNDDTGPNEVAGGG